MVDETVEAYYLNLQELNESVYNELIRLAINGFEVKYLMLAYLGREYVYYLTTILSHSTNFDEFLIEIYKKKNDVPYIKDSKKDISPRGSFRTVNVTIKKELLDYPSYGDNVRLLKEFFKQNGNKLFLVSIPHYLNDEKKVPFEKNIGTYLNCESLLSDYAAKIISEESDKFLCNGYELTRIARYAYQIEKKYEADRKIYLIGPCIANWGSNGDILRLDHCLEFFLQKRGINRRVVPVVSLLTDPDTLFDVVRKYEITENDICFLIDNDDRLGFDNIDENDIDTYRLFADYSGDKWLYYDEPIHATYHGQRKIVEAIIEKIEGEKVHRAEYIREKSVKGIETFLNHDYSSQVDMYIKRIGIRERLKGKIGAIVMNANPFTNGHMHLIEHAMGKVDSLIVFVVEENKSLVPFESRMGLVEEACKNLENVYVVPSGNFIISSYTFSGYFKKEINQEIVIDASCDIELFGRFIAPKLNVSVRFVGEEPNDRITLQYNEQMKRLLPQYGVEVDEIQRLMNSEGRVISASRVRNDLENRIKPYEGVPQITKDFLMQYADKLVLRKKIIGLVNEAISAGKGTEADRIINLRDIRQMISEHERTYIYGTGYWAQLLLINLPFELWDKLMFVDRMAAEGYREFCSFEVKELSEISFDLEYGVVVSSVRYLNEMYLELIKSGVNLNNIIGINC